MIHVFRIIVGGGFLLMVAALIWAIVTYTWVQATLIALVLMIVGFLVAYGIGSIFVFEHKDEDYRDY